MFDIISDEKYLDALGRSSAKIREFSNIIRNLREEIDSVSLVDFMDKVFTETGYAQSLAAENTPEARGRIENLQEFKSKALEYEKNVEDATFGGFLDNISLVSDVDNYDSEQDAIVMMTLHSAKGLEFPVVFMCGLEKGLFPSYQSEGELDKLEEERRLCYVGITRAREKLYITYALQRVMFGKTESKVVSEFVGEIPENLLHRTDNIVRKQFASYGSGRGYMQSDLFASTQKKSDMDYSAIIAGNVKSGAQMKCSETYKIGERVAHKKFGEGMIVGISESGSDVMLEILFDNVGTRNLMASFAKLKKI